MEATGTTVDSRELETKVKHMYRQVAEQPEGKYHFELGRPLAERLGYPPNVGITLDTYSHAVPAMQEDAATQVASLVLNAALRSVLSASSP